MTPSLYSIKQAAEAGKLLVEPVWSQSNPALMPSGFSLMFSFQAGADTYVAGIDADNICSVYKVTNASPWITPVDSNMTFDRKWDSVTPFVIGNMPYLLCYEAKGTFAF